MWPNPLETFTEEILNGKLHFLCSEVCLGLWIKSPTPQLPSDFFRKPHFSPDKDLYFTKMPVRSRQLPDLTIDSKEFRAYLTLREKCPNTEFFLVRIFRHSDQKKLRIWTLFTQCNRGLEYIWLDLPIHIYWHLRLCQHCIHADQFFNIVFHQMPR